MLQTPSKQTDGSSSEPTNSSIKETIGRLFESGQVIELRCLNTEKGTISGYFSDRSKLADAAYNLNKAGVPAVYATINPVKPSLLARAKNRILPYAKQTTADADIVRRCWLPIDLDPVRPAGISSTDEEHEAALARARDIESWLRNDFKFPAGLLGDSGNGGHLLYRIDLPNDDSSRALIELVLKALHDRFSDDKVKVDLTTSNAARIWKVYGTTARKGDVTDDRPHRKALIIRADDHTVVSADLLQKVADLAPKPAKRANGAGGHTQHFDLDGFLTQHGITVKQEKPWAGGQRRLILEECPFDSSHTGTSAAVLQFEDGAIAFRCQHNGCAGKGWTDVREFFEPGYKEHQEDVASGQRIIDSIIGNGAPKQHNAKHETPAEVDDLSSETAVSPVYRLDETTPADVERGFPEAAWSGLFGPWREMAAPCTEASLESIWAAFLLAAGMLIGRKRWRYTPRPVYPNFYVLLLGETGDSRKSTVLWLASEMLRHAGEEIRTLEGVVSSEGLIEALAGREGTKALIFADEFRALLAVAQRKGTLDLLPRLNSLYYCPPQSSVDRVKNPTTAVKPFLSMITATPQEYVDDILSDLEVAGGFLNRCMIITGEEQAPKPIVTTPNDDAWAAIAMRLQKAVDRAPVGNIEFDAQALALWKEFYIEWKKDRRQMKLKDSQLTARTFEHILKIATVYAVLAVEPAISKTSLTTAIEIGGWLQSNTTRLFAATGLDRGGRCEHLILNLLLHAKDKRMWKRDLQMAVGGRGHNAETFNRALRALEISERVECGEDETASRRVRTWVEYRLNTKH